MRMMLSWVLLAGCQVLVACAPMNMDIKSVPAFPSKKTLLECDNNCKPIDVFARINAEGGCEVMPEYEAVYVQPGKTPKMTWRINSLMPANAYDFKFEFDPKATPPRYGIEIVYATTRDFDNPGYPVSAGKPDKEKFEWKNQHQRRLSFDYVINVLSRPHNEDGWTSCRPIDPRIIND